MALCVMIINLRGLAQGKLKIPDGSNDGQLSAQEVLDGVEGLEREKAKAGMYKKAFRGIVLSVVHVLLLVLIGLLIHQHQYAAKVMEPPRQISLKSANFYKHAVTPVSASGGGGDGGRNTSTSLYQDNAKSIKRHVKSLPGSRSPLHGSITSAPLSLFAPL